MLRFEIKTDLPEKVRDAVRDMDAQFAGLLEEIGTQLVSMQAQNFEDKSKGNAGVDGVLWKPLTEATERKKALRGVRRPKVRKDGTRKRRSLGGGAVPKSQIGVDTGRMRNDVRPGYAASFKVKGDGVTVEYRAEYAEHFDEVRPLIPADMPGEWMKSMESIVENWLNERLKDIT